MQPKTKMEKYLSTLKFNDPKINLDKVFTKVGYESKSKIHCMYCGHSVDKRNILKYKIYNYICPICGNKLKLEYTRKRTLNESKYIEVLEVIDGIQAIRIFLACREAKIGELEKHKLVEVVRWIPTKKRNYVFALATSTFFYEWRWVLDSDIELRKITYSNQDKYLIVSDMIWSMKLSNEFKYCNYNSNIKIPSVIYLQNYLHYPQLELLVKTKQYNLIQYCYQGSNFNFTKLEIYKKEFRTVFKSNYKISDYGIWFDYIDLLKYFNKDSSNVKYCCPRDLIKEHNKLVEKKDDIILEEDNKKYISRVKDYYNLDFGNKNISITIIKDLYQMKSDGKELKFCIFTNRYDRMQSSLLFRISVKGKLDSCVEIYNNDPQIVQLRAYDNEVSNYHNDIEKLIKSNLIPYLRKKLLRKAS